MMDLAFEFKYHFGHFPDTWREFVSGLDYLSRKSARDDLRAANVARVAGATEDSAKPWFERQRIASGWS